MAEIRGPRLFDSAGTIGCCPSAKDNVRSQWDKSGTQPNPTNSPRTAIQNGDNSFVMLTTSLGCTRSGDQSKQRDHKVSDVSRNESITGSGNQSNVNQTLADGFD